MKAILNFIFKVFMIIYKSKFNGNLAVIYSIIFVLLSLLIIAWFFIIIVYLFGFESNFFNFLNFINFNCI